MNVTVAAVQAFEIVFEVPGGSPPQGTPWEELQRVDLKAEPDQTLRQVLGRACDALGTTLTDEARRATAAWRRDQDPPASDLHVSGKLVYSGFWRADDDEPIEGWDGSTIVRRDQRRWATVLVVRDAQGRAVWKRPGVEATMAELVDAAGAGLIDGDPLRPYLIPSMPQGDPGVLGEWREFAESLRVLWKVVEAAAAVGGAAALVELVVRLRQRRSAEVPEIVARNGSGWAERGAAPADLIRLLVAADRTSDEVAALLGCSVPEAEALMWGLGFAFEPTSNRWRYKGDALARLVGDDVNLSFADAFRGSGGLARFEAFASRRLEQTLETGEAPTTEEAERDLSEWTDRYFEGLAEPAHVESRVRRWLRRGRH